MAKAPKSETAEPPAGHIQSLEKGLNILDEIIAAPAPVKLAEIIKRFDMDKASAFRFLQTLEHQGFLHKDPESKEYEIGSRLYYWAAQLRQKTRIIDTYHRHLERLASMTQQTTHLGLLVNDRVLLADFAVSTSMVSIRHAIGSIEPLHSSAAGKAIIAFLPKDRRDELIDKIEFTKFTERTITTRTDLVMDLEMTRQRGYAVDAGESYGGLHCVARPILNRRGEPFASLGISTITALISSESDKFREIVDALAIVAADIERELPE
ncbi:MAG: IclR family transcriptional regulator [Shinella sp.]|nr:MAG: IclR family transcriptional regulator [Shinella sp.]